MKIQDRFLEYVNAFELTYEDNDWSRLKTFFTVDATYDGGLGEIARGLPAVLANLEGAVDGFDRLMDTRELELTPPTSEADTVRVHWTARYSKAGLPDLTFGGTEYARFEGDQIAQLWDELDPGAKELLGSWLAEHGESLSQ